MRTHNHARLLIIAATSSGYLLTSWQVDLGITDSYTLILLIFSSMTCFRQLKTNFSASSRLIAYMMTRMYWFVLPIEDVLDALVGGSDALCLELDHGARWVCLVERRPLLIHPSDKQGHTVRPRHGLLLGGGISLPKVQGQIRY